MQAISDKKLDQLFKDRFNTYEVEPSAGLWDKINNQLEPPVEVKKKPFPLLWMAAASTAIVLGAGLWLYQPDELMQSGPKRNRMAVEKAKQIDHPAHSSLEQVSTGEIAALKQSRASKSDDLKSERSKVQVYENVIAQVSAKASEPLLPVEAVKKEYEETVSLASIQEVKSQGLNKEELKEPIYQTEIVLAQEIGDKEEQEPEAGHHKIKSLGGLLNFVIAKVDKRDSKIIEFKESDEGAEVSGINLGFVKIKSRNK